MRNRKSQEASINLTENKYISKKPYRCSIPDQKEREFQITKLLETQNLFGMKNAKNHFKRLKNTSVQAGYFQYTTITKKYSFTQMPVERALGQF